VFSGQPEQKSQQEGKEKILCESNLKEEKKTSIVDVFMSEVVMW